MDTIEKLDMKTPDFTDQNIQKIADLFPNCITESENGHAIDFDLLKQELSKNIVEGTRERYQLSWPGKAESLVNANTPINKALRPCREESVDFDNTQNLYIEGDNLEVLKMLQETYLNKVKMIYIDPPYNTGDDILYKNNYHITQKEHEIISSDIDESGYKAVTNTESNGRFHSDWLSDLYPKLKLARNLLTEDGIIVITIDYHELCNLGTICDEVFGYSNRLGLVTILHNPKGRNQSKFFSENSEYMLLFAKESKKAAFNKVAIDEDILASFDKVDDNGKYRYEPYIRARTEWSKLKRPNNWYPIYVSEDCSLITSQKKEGYIELFPQTSSGDFSWKNIKSSFDELNKNDYFKVEIENGNYVLYHKYYEQQVFKNVWLEQKYQSEFHGTAIVKKLFDGKNLFSFPKSLYAVKDIIKMIADKNSIVVDFFSGSATTAHAVMQLNAEDQGQRKFIMAQIPQETEKTSDAFKAGYRTIPELAKERIRRAGKQINEELPDTQADLGFRVLKVDDSCMKDVYYTPDEIEQASITSLTDNIKSDCSEEDLLFQVMLDWGVDLTFKIERKEIHGQLVFFVNDDDLVACFGDQVTEDLIKELASYEPLRVVLKDSSFNGNDDLKTNTVQIFKQLSEHTQVKVI